MTAAARHNRPNTWLWILASFAVAIFVAAATLFADGIHPDGVSSALRNSARFSFLLFWGAYAGGLLKKIPLTLTQELSRRRREFGLSFAAAHSVHLALILVLFYISSRPPVSLKTIIVDGIGFGWMYLLVIFSFDFARKRLSPPAWRLLFNVGLEYIAFVFATDFILNHLRDGKDFTLFYWPFIVMLAGTAFLRWASGGWWLLTRALGAHRSPGAA
ncbi:MAG TPA: hypothetical protein VN723_12440 [Rhizomicrobium sp.]|jgi:hypothetical protein|nr:hypothetical protein [Rhizomicrobium sp.]